MQEISHLSFAAQNVNSLNISTNCPKKLQKVTAILALNATIIFLSDTRLNTKSAGNTNIFSPAYEMFENSATSKRGVAILLSRKLAYSIEYQYRDINGNILGLLLNINSCRILVVAIYGPNTNDPNFFSDLSGLFNKYRDLPLVCGGDWNLTYCTEGSLNNIDILNMLSPPSAIRSMQLSDICEKFQLCDPYRALHHAKRDFTYVPRTGKSNRSRIDFFIISDTLLSICNSCDISPSLNTSLFDHKSVNLFFRKEKRPGKVFIDNLIFSHPRFNAVVATAATETYLQHADREQNGLDLEAGLAHVGRIIAAITRANEAEFDLNFSGRTNERELQLSALNADVYLLVEDLPEPELLNDIQINCANDVFLEVLMGNIRNALISFQTWIKKVRDAKTNALIKNISELKNDFLINSDRIFALEAELCELRDGALKSKIQERKIFEHLHHERPSPLYLNLIKKSNSDSLSRIVRDDGSEFQSNIEREEYIVKYYENVYDKERNKNSRNFQGQYEGCIQNFLGHYVTNHPLVQGSILNQQERDLLDRPLTIQELDESLEKCNKKSAPGMDGFSNLLIQKCWKYLRLPLLNYATHCFEVGELTPNFKNACIRLIPKKGETNLLKNWRPISLLSNMYKVISRAINSRLAKVNNRICSRAQKGYNDKRYVQEVLINTCESINYCQKNNINGSVLAIDMAKAFDTLDHDFINEVYKFFGLGPNIIRWLNLCGNNRTACIILDNNKYSRTFSLGCGRPQGDNTSPCTFNFCEQILIFKLELSQEIARIPRNPQLVVTPNDPFLFESNRETDANESLADDNTLLSLINRGSLLCVKSILNDFFQTSGLKCNYEKTMLMPMLDISGEERDMIEELGFKVVSELTLLGAKIFRNLEQLHENWTKVREKIINLISFWERFRLSLPGRIAIAKTYLISQINYLGCIFSFKEEDIDSIQLLINNFIRKNLRLSEQRIYLAPEYGGIGFFKISEFLAAQKCIWILRAKKYPIDNWRYDLISKSPSHNPLLLRASDVDAESHPVLHGMAISYEKFYAEYSKHERNYINCYIFKNRALGERLIDEQLFGRYFFQAHKERIRNLKFSDCFRDNIFKLPEDFATDGLPITMATWLNLRNILVSARRRYQDEHSEADCMAIEDFCDKFKKGSKKIRSFFDYTRNRETKIEESRCFLTFKNLVDCNPVTNTNLGIWTSAWTCNSLANELKVFIFNCRYNLLPLNNRLHSYRPEVDPRCTFCRIRDNETTQRDSFVHFFFNCATTKYLLNYIISKLNLDPETVGGDFKQMYWYGIHGPNVTKMNNFLTTLLFDVFRYILYKHKIRRHIPNRDVLYNELIFTMEIIFKCSRKLKQAAVEFAMFANLLQAIG
jgi:exonuclease III